MTSVQSSDAVVVRSRRRVVVSVCVCVRVSSCTCVCIVCLLLVLLLPSGQDIRAHVKETAKGKVLHRVPRDNKSTNWSKCARNKNWRNNRSSNIMQTFTIYTLLGTAFVLATARATPTLSGSDNSVRLGVKVRNKRKFK